MEQQLIKVLKALVQLKDHKDKYGKDEMYINEQPKIWELAKKTLKQATLDTD